MKKYKYQDRIVALLHKHHLLGVGELHRLISLADYSTIYRNISRLTADGVLKRLMVGNKKIKYELSQKAANHGHFVCLDCEEITTVPYSAKQENRRLKNGAVAVDVLWRGYCRQCRVS